MVGASGSGSRPVERRVVLLGGAGALLAAAGCTGGAPGRATPTTAPATPGSLPRATPWRPLSGEIHPEVKLRAARLVEALGTWPSGKGDRAAAKARVTALRLPAGLVDRAGPLLPSADAAVFQVVYAQYGGILSDAASVLVVGRQWTRHGDRVTADGTTVDVRLARTGAGWNVTDLRPARPGAAVASLSAPVRKALADGTRITLPPAAEADLRSGLVHDSVADAMLRLARTYRLEVSVVRSGHPLHVFGTDRPSDHPRGRAFDVWRIDSRAVVDPSTPRTLIERFMRDAAAAGSYNVGGPVRLSGGATPDQFFSDNTHHDHVHLGFRG
ncbi:hypothetical protein [Streptomyces nodosus]|uniref:hypothetical protein n=1 Tax=Streptomyces nodosus TaxID=40318 RepID=UPI003807163D